jgi:hypothetical protein
MSRILLLVAVYMGMLLGPRVAAAYAIMPKPTVLDAYKDADVVVMARAIAVEKIDDASPTPTKFEASTTM